MRRYRALAELFAQMPRYTLGHAPRVDEDQRRAMLFDQFGKARIDFLPDVPRHDCLQRRLWHFDCEVTLARVADVDDFALWSEG
jgi:hypothetical protein